MIETSSPAALRWAIVGTGEIARQFAADMDHAGGNGVAAIVSREVTRAEAFARSFCPEAVAFGSVEQACLSGLVDAVYVATPHPAHRAAACDALGHKIPVLIEKPITASMADLDAIMAASERMSCPAREALWTLCLPAVKAARDVAASGRIGAIRSIEAELSFERRYDPEHRLFSPELGGGVLLDLGVYPLAVAQAFAGPMKLELQDLDHAPTGVDSRARQTLSSRSGADIFISVGFEADGINLFVVRGERGSIVLQPPFLKASGYWLVSNHAAKLLEHRGSAGRIMRALTRRVPVPGFQYHRHPFPGGGLLFEIAEFARLVAEGGDSSLSDLDESRATLALIREAIDR